jgi:hypothetical protein
MKDPTYLELLTFCECLDDLTVAEAIYWFACNFHDGQWSNLYKAISECGYKPSPLHSGPTGDAIALYDDLVEHFT